MTPVQEFKALINKPLGQVEEVKVKCFLRMLSEFFETTQFAYLK